MFYLAIDPTPESLRVALVEREATGERLIYATSVPLDVDPLYILRPLFQGKRCHIVSGLKSGDVLLRSLILKLRSRREIFAALPFQVEGLIPYRKDEMLLLPTLYPLEGKETDIFLLASSKESLSLHLATLDTLSIQPDIVSCTPLALFRFAQHYFPKHSSLFVLDVGEKESTFITIQDGRLHSSHRQNFGNQALKEQPELFAQELTRVTAYLKKKSPKLSDLLLTGISENISILHSMLTTHFSIIPTTSPKKAEFATVIGLSLDAAKGDKQSAQFRLKDNQSEAVTGRKKSNLVGFAAASLCFSLFTLTMGGAYLEKKERAALISLNLAGEVRLKHAVETLTNSLREKRKATLDIPTVPTVSYLLKWLSHNPGLQKETSITHFHYTLVKPPKLGAKKKVYQVKVDLTLTTPDARAATLFHRSLLQEKRLIDQKQKIKWSADHGVYEASFFLKPQRMVR